VTISGYSQPWQIESHLRALREERKGREAQGDTATIATIDAQVELFTAELKRLRREEVEAAAAHARELESQLGKEAS
jgi:hypothetical protein